MNLQEFPEVTPYSNIPHRTKGQIKSELDGAFRKTARALRDGFVSAHRARGRRYAPWQTLEGSFSAVSKPNFASKYALESLKKKEKKEREESSCRDLHNALLCTAIKPHCFF